MLHSSDSSLLVPLSAGRLTSLTRLNLDRDALASIMTMLSNDERGYCARMCRPWNAAVNQKMAWSYSQLSIGDSSASTPMPMRYRKFIRSLHTKMDGEATADIVEAEFGNVTTLRCEWSAEPCHSVHHLFRLTHLTSLTVTLTHESSPFLLLLDTSLPHLTTICLHFSSLLSSLILPPCHREFEKSGCRWRCCKTMIVRSMPHGWVFSTYSIESGV